MGDDTDADRTAPWVVANGPRSDRPSEESAVDVIPDSNSDTVTFAECGSTERDTTAAWITIAASDVRDLSEML